MRFIAVIAALAAGPIHAEPHDEFSDCTLSLAWLIMQERETKDRILEGRLNSIASSPELDEATAGLFKASSDFLNAYADYCATLR